MGDGEAGGGVAWRQSLGAGLLLGLALGCAWLAHWTPLTYTRLLLLGIAALLTLLGIGLMLSLSEGRGWTAGLERKWEAHFAGAGLPFFSALLILGLAAMVTGNNLIYLIVSGLLAVLVISGLTSALNLSGMELRFRLPAEIFAGKAVPVVFTLTNAKGFWPAYSVTVNAASRQPAGAAARIAGLEAGMQPVYFAYLPRRRSVTAASDILFPRRGRYASTAFVLTTRFPFGLLHKRRRFQPSGREPEMLVYPAPLPVPGLRTAVLRAGQREPRPHRGDGQDLHLIRAHQAGDSARHVHWKASARAGALRVREFSDESATRMRLRLALPPTLEPERAEAALSRCAGWLVSLASQDAREQAGSEIELEFLGCNAPGLWLPPAPASEQRRAVLEYLARVDTGAAWVEPGAHPADVYEVLVDSDR